MRYMRGNKSARVPENHLFIDTETNLNSVPGKEGVIRHSLRLWCVKGMQTKDGEVVRSYHETGYHATDFWKLVYQSTSNRYVLWVWAHNMSFDFTQLDGWQELDDGRLLLDRVSKREYMCKDGCKRTRRSNGTVLLADKLFLIKCMTKSGHRINFISSTNFFPCKLAELGELVGIKKMDIDYERALDSRLVEYCFNDVETLAAAVLGYVNFVRENDLGMFRPTIGSQAMGAFRHRFKRHDIMLHDIEAVRRIEYDAHLGGECRAFFLGKVGGPWDSVNTDDDMLMEEYKNVIISKIFELDVNSLYPSVMLYNHFPSQLVGVVDYEGREGWPNNIPAIACIAAVKLDTSVDCYPVRVDGRTSYCRGRFWTTLCGPELEHACCKGHVKNTGLICMYYIAPLFTDYVSTLWQMRIRFRQDGNEIYSELVKKFLVSIYGKWSQRQGKWRDCDNPEEWLPWGTWIVSDQSGRPPRKYRAIAGNVQIEVDERGPSGIFPAISAFVTSYGRIRMRQLREMAGDREVFYQGIDSLHVTRTGHDRLKAAGMVSQTRLGALRKEGEHEQAFYWGPMDYMLSGQIVRAGWKQSGKAEGVDSWRQTEFEGIDSILSQKPTGNIYQWDRVLKHGKPFIHGTVGVDGWLVPTTLNREEQACL